MITTSDCDTKWPKLLIMGGPFLDPELILNLLHLEKLQKMFFFILTIPKPVTSVHLVSRI